MLEEGLRQRGAGIVDQDVERAGRGDRGRQGSGVGHIGDQALAADLLRRAGQRFAIAAEHGDTGALGGETLGDRAADALAAAGDEREFAVERAHIGVSAAAFSCARSSCALPARYGFGQACAR